MKIVALSDQHGHWPEVPLCDLLIIAGDQCIDRFDGGSVAAWQSPARQRVWFHDIYLPWLAMQPAKKIVFVWGNHDFCGRLPVTIGDPRVTLLSDSMVTVNGLKIWGSPYSPKFGAWAFMDSEAGLATRYELIPADTDIIVSHGPPHTCGDLTLSGSHVGSKALLAAIERVRPKAVFCGHIHEAAGAYERCGHGHRTPVYNVSVVDECYQMVHEPTVLHDSDLAPYPSLAEIEGQ